MIESKNCNTATPHEEHDWFEHKTWIDEHSGLPAQFGEGDIPQDDPDYIQMHCEGVVEE